MLTMLTIVSKYSFLTVNFFPKKSTTSRLKVDFVSYTIIYKIGFRKDGEKLKEINCGPIIIGKRREKNITQEELALHLGVTKASVSKWETGVSYPDITLLPALAAYFDISIDYLMGYSPQMTYSDIKKLYQRLAQDFAKKPFEEVFLECEDIVKKYFSCYELLHQISLLYLNHSALAIEASRISYVITRATELCERIIKNSKDQSMILGTINIKAHCHLALNEPELVLDLLGESLIMPNPDKTLIARAYQMLGDEEKYLEVLQIDLYTQLMSIFDSLMINLQSNLEDLARAELIFTRAENMADIFNMTYLNANNVAILHFLGAQMYQLSNMQDNAIEQLSKFVDVCINHLFPVVARADEFFYKLTNFTEEDTAPVPRSEDSVKKDILQYFNNPIFESLSENPEFKKIIKK